MKVVLFCGGKGSRLSDSDLKPMTNIGEKPIIWHLMNWYAKFGHTDFILLTGYKHELIKQYFCWYQMLNSDITINLKTNNITVHKTHEQDWNVTIANTGIDTNTSGRLYLAKKYLENDKQFLLNYSDGLSNVDINKVIECHNASNKCVTLTAFRPSARFGYLSIDKNNSINTFIEKAQGENNFVNGGYFVCNNKIFDYITDDLTVQFEKGPLAKLATASQLNCYKHYGFLSPMDTPRDKEELISLWNSGNAPWKI